MLHLLLLTSIPLSSSGSAGKQYQVTLSTGLSEEIETSLKYLIRDIEAPATCQNGNSDECCGLTLTGLVIAELLKHELKVVDIEWQSNADPPRKAAQALISEGSSEIWFSCRYEATAKHPEVDELVEIAMYVFMEDRNPHFSMRCLKPTFKTAFFDI